MLQTMSTLRSSHVELSELSRQLQQDQHALITHKFLESPANQSLNCYYFPYYALVERYIGTAIEYADKLCIFKQLLLESLQHRHSQDMHHQDASDESVSELIEEHDVKENEVEHLQEDTEDCKSREESLTESLPQEYSAISTPMSSTPIECEEMYLPTIDEDKETVYSYHSYHIANGYDLDGHHVGVQSHDSNDNNDSESDHMDHEHDQIEVEQHGSYGSYGRGEDGDYIEDIDCVLTTGTAGTIMSEQCHEEMVDAKVIGSESAGSIPLNALSLRHDDSEYVYSSESGTEEEESIDCNDTFGAFMEPIETSYSGLIRQSEQCKGMTTGLWKEMEWISNPNTMGYAGCTPMTPMGTSLRITQSMSACLGIDFDSKHRAGSILHWNEGDGEELRTLFSRFGSVKSIDIKGVAAVVEYERIEDVNDAMQCMEEGHVLMWQGRTLCVERM